MDKKKFMKRFALWTAVVVAAVILIIGLCCGKVVEDNLTQEILKWVVGGIGVICIFEVLAFSVGQICYHWMDDYKKLYGDKWFTEGIKDEFRGMKAKFTWKGFINHLCYFISFFAVGYLLYRIIG